MTILSLFVFLMMFVMGGIAVDVMNQEHKRVALQQTLDSAVLASANLRQTQNPQDVVRDYFTKAELVQYLDPMEATDYAIKANERRVQATAGMDVPTYFMKLSGIDHLSTVTVAAAEQSMETGAPADKEVSIVIDISGSMRDNGRIDALRGATKDMVSTLLTGAAGDTTSINLVPYAGHVNPGADMFELLGGVRYGTTGEDLFPESRKDISNVVFYYDRITGDTEPYDYATKIEGYPDLNVNLFNKDDLDEYVFFADAYLRRHDASLSDTTTLVGLSYKAGKNDYGPYLMDGTIGSFDTRNQSTVDAEHMFNNFYDEVIPQYASCIDFGPDDFDHVALPDDGTYDQVPHFNNWPADYSAMDWGWCPEDDAAIQYAQNDEAALHDYIDALRLHDGTGTHYGMKYGLALLDPGSQDEFQELSNRGSVPYAFADRPKAWTDTSIKKYIVLLSEGSISSQPRPTHPLDPVNQATALSNRNSAETETFTSGAGNVQDFYDICDMAKAQGVEIFTIAFEANASGKEQMKNCASSPSHYFDAAGSDLSGIFGSVGKQITQLRLVK